MSVIAQNRLSEEQVHVVEPAMQLLSFLLQEILDISVCL